MKKEFLLLSILECFKLHRVRRSSDLRKKIWSLGRLCQKIFTRACQFPRRVSFFLLTDLVNDVNHDIIFLLFRYIYEPWTAPMSIQEEAKCIIGKDYPQRIVIHEEASSKNTKHMNSIKEKLLKELNNEVCTMLQICYIALLHIPNDQLFNFEKINVCSNVF